MTQQATINASPPPGYLSKTYNDPNPGWRPSDTDLPEVNSRWKNRRTGEMCVVVRVEYAMENIINVVYDDGSEYMVDPDRMPFGYEKC